MTDLRQELIREATAGNKESVGTLLEKGAPVDAEDTTGGTALMSSASNGHLDVVKLLAAKGANIHHQNANGCTALLLAANNKHRPVCLFLISLGADPTVQDLPCWRGPSAIYAGTDLQDARQAYLATMLHCPPRTNASLLFSDAFSDLVFVCPGGERIHAHRNIVAACSPHMNALLQGPWAENADERVAVVQMPQSFASLRALLRFMYTGEVDAAVCTSHTMDVLDLASQHEQPYLKTACWTLLGETVQLPSLIPILEIALLHDIKELKIKCVAFAEKHIADLSLPELIQMANKRSIPELKAACERGAIAILTATNVLSYLEAAFSLDMPLLKAWCLFFVEKNIINMEKNIINFRLSDLVQSAAWKSVPELKAACERACIAMFSDANVVSFLEVALRHDMPLLKIECLALLSKHTDLVASQAFVDLATSNPKLWAELRTALGVKA